MVTVLAGGIGQRKPAVAGASTWDPNNTNYAVVLSLLDLLATYSGGLGGAGLVRGTKSHTGSGAWYFEILCPVIGSGLYCVGLVGSSYSIPTGTYIGDAANSWGMWPSPYAWVAYNGAAGAQIDAFVNPGAVLGFSVFLNFSPATIYVSVDGGDQQIMWQGAANNLSLSNILFPACSVDLSSDYTTPSSALLNTAGPFVYGPPSGFQAWG